VPLKCLQLFSFRSAPRDITQDLTLQQNSYDEPNLAYTPLNCHFRHETHGPCGCSIYKFTPYER